MKPIARLSTAVLCAGGLLWPAALAAQTPPTTNVAGAANEVDAAPFIFLGMVSKPYASNLKLVAPSDRSALVRVDEILKGSPVFAGLAGREVTLITPPGAAVPQGRAVFFVRPTLYAESIAGELLSTRPADEAPAIRAFVASEAARLETLALSRSVRAATLVVDATVRAVEPLPKTRIGSEHDPDLHRATLSVRRTLSGRATDTVVVYFAHSTDERWYRSPKLAVGQTALFLLRQDEASQLPPPASAAVGGGFTVLDEGDVRPVADTARVQTLFSSK